MNRIEITSADNKMFKYIRALSQKKARKENGEFVVEGIKSVSEALTSGRRIRLLAVADSFYQNTVFSYPQDIPVYVMPDYMLQKLCDTQNPQGILAVIRMRGGEDFFPSEKGMYVYCDDLNDPGNLGTIIRCADAAGFSGVLLSPNCVDVYNPKAVRATMGSFFHTDIIENVTVAQLMQYRNAGFTLYGGALLEGAADYRRPDYGPGSVIVVGNEANGISPEVLSLCIPVKIPIYGQAESLNAGVAASLLMYEAANRRFG